MRPAVGHVVGRHNARAIANIAAAVVGGIAVENLFVPAAFRHAQQVAFAWHRCEIVGHDHKVRRIFCLAHEAEHAVLPVVAIDPFEARVIEIDFVQSRLAAHELVQIGHGLFQTLVRFPLQQMPLQAFVVIPFVPLAEVAAHIEQLLAGMRPHVAEQKPHVGELLPQVAGHLIQERALAVHNFIVRKRQDKIFVEGVNQRERQLIVMKRAVNWILAEVAERVVHPAHVPFEAESQPAHVGGARNAGPRGRFLGNRQNAGVLQVRLQIEFLDERNGLQIFAAAKFVGNPIARLPAVIEVQHRGHGVDPQAIDVVLVEPKQGVAQQEIANFIATIVENERSPIGMFAAARIFVFVHAPCHRSGAGRGHRGGNVREPNRSRRQCRSGGSDRRST